MSFKLIAIDLDGTIVDVNNVVSPKIIEVLNKCHQRGIEIIVVTGRSLFNALTLLKKYQLDSIVNMILATNGSVTHDVAQNKLIDFKVIPYSLLDKLHQWTKDLNLSLVLTPISAKKSSYYIGHRPGKKEIDFFLNELLPITLPTLRKTEISSGIVLGDIDNIQKFATMVKKETSLQIVAGSVHSIQFSNSNKGSSLLQITIMKKIEINQVLVLGDSPNDIPMFKIFPHSVAMGNAFGGAKKYAAHVTETIENNGAAKAIEKMILADKFE